MVDFFYQYEINYLYKINLLFNKQMNAPFKWFLEIPEFTILSLFQ